MNPAQEAALGRLDANRETFFREYPNQWIAVRAAERFDLTVPFALSGSVPAALMRGIDLEFQGFHIRADVMFDYSNSVDPLFGHSGILALKDLGLDRTDWHWDK